MFVEGPSADGAGREYVAAHKLPSQPPTYPPDTLIVSPEKELLGRLDWNASVEETVEFLGDVLARHPELNSSAPVAAGPAGPSRAEAELQSLTERFDHCARTTLIEPLEAWLKRHAAAAPNGAAMARTMLGAARYHAGDYEGADAAWREVLRLHPDHPLRHRARYNLLGGNAWPCGMHPDLLGARTPNAEARIPTIPFPEQRRRNLERVHGDRDYRRFAELPFARLPAGTFLMGASAPPYFPRELPVREVTLDRDILFAAWPVTRGLWARFQSDRWAGAESRDLAAELPATRITYREAQEFCQWLSAQEKRTFRLPTEAEWEYAARGGMEKAPYPWGWELPDEQRCNHAGRSPVPVACYAPNGFGLFDMVGNITEWCADYYCETAYKLTPRSCTNPRGPSRDQSDDGMRVVRSGLAGDTVAEVLCRNTWRLGFPEDFSLAGLGFRLVTDED